MDNKKDKGFTLVELLIVIVILGILATITVFAVRGITDQGQTSACAADKKTLQTAVEAHYAQKGTATPLVETAGTAEGQLVTENLLVSASSNYNVTAAGGLTYENAKCIPAGAPAANDAVGEPVPA